MRVARSVATATAISGDRVLIAGGMVSGGGSIREFEVFDPSMNRVVAAGQMDEARAGHSATRLADWARAHPRRVQRRLSQVGDDVRPTNLDVRFGGVHECRPKRAHRDIADRRDGSHRRRRRRRVVIPVVGGDRRSPNRAIPDGRFDDRRA